MSTANTQTPFTASPLEMVKDNFKAFGLLDEHQVKFLKGYFNVTLPTAPVEKLSLLRVDSDIYVSTYETLEFMYPKLELGGYVFCECREWGVKVARRHP